MKNVILFDTAVGTLNHGDEIIMESLLKNADDILRGNNVYHYPTHTPCFHFYQQTKRNGRFTFVRDADYKFICGTNILNNKIIHPLSFWNVNIFNCKCYKNSVAVGVGVSGFKPGSDKLSFYSKLLFSKILSKKYIHSARDERTKRIIESICGKGSAINTGCPTTWGLTKEHCAQIPKSKQDKVVFTLTDYSRNKVNDQRLIDILTQSYKEVYFWPQGSKDLIYFEAFKNIDKIKVLSPSVREYSKLLSEGSIDYVGTRLHAGIFAMQHKVRSIILIVDNRAKDMADTYNINTIPRDSESLADMINSDFETKININEDAINQWKSQFIGGEK